MKLIDLTGKRFTRLSVIERVQHSDKKNTYWLCKCDCGNKIIVSTCHLRSGHTKSCGCYSHDLIKKHGMWDSRIYGIWQNIKTRCTNSNSTFYNRYGGRGITICNEWKDNFKAFYDWAIANGYQDNLTIDRIDNNGNYEPNNCRWVTMKIQSNNTRRNHLIEYKGCIHTLTQWAEILNISRKTLWNRIDRGWSIERAFSEKIHNLKYTKKVD